jgi:hypothetical protein
LPWQHCVTPDNKCVVTGSIRSKLLTVIDLRTDQIAFQRLRGRGLRRALRFSINTLVLP